MSIQTIIINENKNCAHDHHLTINECNHSFHVKCLPVGTVLANVECPECTKIHRELLKSLELSIG